MLRLERIAKRHAGVVVLDELSLHVAAGECLALTGPDDAAAAVMAVAATLRQPDSGAVLIDGIDAVRDPYRARRRLAYVGADGLGTRARLRLADAWRTGIIGRSTTATRANQGTFLHRTGLDLSLPIDSLSYGSRKRAGIAMALDMHAPLTLLHLPFAGLDQHESKQIVEWIVAANHTGRAIVATVDATATAPWASRTVRLES